MIRLRAKWFVTNVQDPATVSAEVDDVATRVAQGIPHLHHATIVSRSVFLSIDFSAKMHVSFQARLSFHTTQHALKIQSTLDMKDSEISDTAQCTSTRIHS